MIYMDYSVETVERSVYNLLMLLGDVGGLYGLLFSVFATLNNVFNFQKSENIMVESLYRDKTSLISTESQYAIKEYL